jgi:4-hydroxybenzoate polyprenyltransferase
LSLDWRAILLGAAVGLAIAFPGLVLGGLLDVELFAIVVLGGFVGAGYVAGSKRPDAPLSHGILAALVTFGIAEAIAIALILAKGNDLHPAVYVFLAGVAAGLGLIGGTIAERRSTGG